jgi:alpha-galactosidase
MLDFSRTDVRTWAVGWLDDLVSDNQLDYLKWDMNRPLAEPRSESGTVGGTVWMAHVWGLHEVWDELRARHPQLWIETCASGGGRADLGSLARTHWAWPSDDTDPVERIDIQGGFTMVNLAMSMACWVTDSPTPLGRRTTPLRFRFHVAMCGVLGVGGDISRWSLDDLSTARELVTLYKDVRPLVQHGELYRLPSPAPGRTTAVAYVAPDRRRAAVFVFVESARYTTVRQSVRLRGLNPALSYAVRDTETGQTWRRSGGALQERGLLVAIDGQWGSTVLIVDAC